MENYVILVDELDNKIGQEEKMKAHELWLLHRAFSVLVFNSAWKLLLQQRAMEKYHCWWLRTNSVCSHPRPGEDYETWVHARLLQEFGFDCPVEYKFQMTYKATFDNGLTEHEIDKIYIWTYDGEVFPNPDEIMDYRRIEIPELQKDMSENPQKYTERFKLIISKL